MRGCSAAGVRSDHVEKSASKTHDSRLCFATLPLRPALVRCFRYQSMMKVIQMEDRKWRHGICIPEFCLYLMFELKLRAAERDHMRDSVPLLFLFGVFIVGIQIVASHSSSSIGKGKIHEGSIKYGFSAW